MADFGKIVSEQASLMNAHALPVEAGDDVQNAETDGRAIYVNPLFMSQVESAAGEDGVRFVLAHELGHSINGMDISGHQGEFAADSFAARSVALAGGSFESIGAVFGMLGGSDSETHPGSGRRSSAAAHEFERSHTEYAGREIADEQMINNEPDARPRARDLQI